MKKIFLISLMIFLALLMSMLISNNSLVDENEFSSVKQKIVSVEYIVRDPIYINGNDDLLSQAGTEGWAGSGTSDDPIIIEGYEIIHTLSWPIKVEHTNLYIQVSNNILCGDRSAVWRGIWLRNVTHSTIAHNVIYDSYMGIDLQVNSSYNTIYNNTIYGTQYETSLRLEESNYNNVTNNVIYDNILEGILVDSSTNNIIENNIIYENSRRGIELEDATNNSIINNTVFSNVNEGIHLLSSGNNTITNNTISNNSGEGIRLDTSSNSNFISNNTLRDHPSYGLRIDFSSDSNVVKSNYFYDNNPGGSSQAIDDGNSNIFESNFWNDWDGTGIYFIDFHDISIPDIIFPNSGENLSEIVTIQWTEALDTLNYLIFYTFSYSLDGGNNWTIVATNLFSTSYNWDTTNLTDGANYLIKVEAFSGTADGLVVEDISDNTIFILNTPISSSNSSSSTNTSSQSDETPSDQSAPGWSILLLFLSFLCLIRIRNIKMTFE
ncbi:MAG: NosD domain-containing protein [Candidatus Hodarchaeales archaeon]